LHVLMIGDVIGKPGRKALNQLLPGLRREYDLDLIIANGENSAGGVGITPTTADELIASGVDVITTGNHIWAQREIIPYLESQTPILRPLNYPPGAPGRGYLFTKHAMVVNLIGRTFIGTFDCPFRAMDTLLASLRDKKAIIIDFHAEATSEKIALGRYLAGRVSAVLGTHTHVGTIDSCILNGGTAYVTDVGMVGPEDSVIGDDTELVMSRFLTQMPHRIAVGKGKVSFNAMVIEIDDISGKSISIERIKRETD
jgi:metallophosphoesterase (TIGR00282 family)